MKKALVTISIIVAGAAVYLSAKKETKKKKTKKQDNSHVVINKKQSSNQNKENELVTKVEENESTFDNTDEIKSTVQSNILNRHAEAAEIIRDSVNVVMNDDTEEDFSDDLEEVSDGFDQLLGDE